MYVHVFAQDDLRPLGTLSHILSGTVPAMHNQSAQAVLSMPMSSPEVRALVNDTNGYFDMRRLADSSTMFFGVVRDGRGRIRMSGRMSLNPGGSGGGGETLDVVIADMLDELRLLPLPPNSSYNGYLLPLLEQTLAIMPAGLYRHGPFPVRIDPESWRLGSVANILNAWTSQDVSNQTCLETIISLCDATGNFLRLSNGHQRKIDVYSDPGDGNATLYVVQGAFFGQETSGKIVQFLQEPTATIEKESVVAGVIPEGGAYRKLDNVDRTLRLDGTEIVPSGYKLYNYKGYWGVFNVDLIGETPTSSLPRGKIQVESFGSIQPLVNTDENVSFVVTRASADNTETLLSGAALDGYEPNHWRDAEVAYGDQQNTPPPAEDPVVFKVTASAGDTITVRPFVNDAAVTGYKLVPQIGDTVSLSVFREWDEKKIADARQSLAGAAVAFLQFNSQPLVSWTVLVPSSDVLVRPGDKIRLTYSGAVKLRGMQSDVTQIVDGVHINDDFVVNQVTLSQQDGGVETEELQVTERLWRFPSTSGLREIMALIQRRMPGVKMGNEGAPYLRQYVVTISSTSAPCGGGKQASISFVPAFSRPPRISAVEPLISGVTATASVTASTLTVCASAPGSVRVTVVPGSIG